MAGDEDTVRRCVACYTDEDSLEGLWLFMSPDAWFSKCSKCGKDPVCGDCQDCEVCCHQDEPFDAENELMLEFYESVGVS